MRMPFAAPIAALALSGALLVSAPIAAAQGGDDSPPAAFERPALVVTGVGVVEAPADQVRIVLSVRTEGDEDASPREVTNENSRKMRDVMKALTRAGVSEEDIETSRFNVQPMYNRPRRDAARVIVGYRVENEIRVITQDLEQAPVFIQAALDAGANRVSSVSYGLADERLRRRQAIIKAMQTARDDAEAAAAAASVSLERIRRIELNQPRFNRPQPVLRAQRAFDADEQSTPPPPLEAGKIEVTAQVTIVYEIAQAADGRAAQEIDVDQAFEALRLDDARRRARERGDGDPR